MLLRSSFPLMLEKATGVRAPARLAVISMLVSVTAAESEGVALVVADVSREFAAEPEMATAVDAAIMAAACQRFFLFINMFRYAGTNRIRFEGYILSFGRHLPHREADGRRTPKIILSPQNYKLFATPPN